MGRAGTDVGSRVEALLEQLRRQGGDPAVDTGEELVRELVAFYGDGLERIVSALAAAAPDVLADLTRDPLVEAQLILHDLHPRDVHARIEAALDAVRPYLGSHTGGVAYLGLDAEGVAHLRLSGSCDGCPSSAVTARHLLEQAVRDAVPEVAAVRVENAEPRGPGLLQIGPRPGLARA